MNFEPAVTAFEPFDRQAKRMRSARSRPIESAGEIDVSRAGAANHKIIGVLRIAIDEIMRVVEIFDVELFGAEHPDLLVDRENGSDRAVLESRLFDEIFYDADDDCDAHAVVGAERRAVRAEIFFVANELNRIGERIVSDAVVGDANHIHMRLQNRARNVFATVGGFEVGDNISDRVALDAQAQSV